jgi:hypothetical protein
LTGPRTTRELAELSSGVVDRVAGFTAEESQSGNGDDRNERDDEGVFDEALTVVVAEHCGEILKHGISYLQVAVVSRGGDRGHP